VLGLSGEIVLPYHDFDKKDGFSKRSEFLIPFYLFGGKRGRFDDRMISFEWS